MLGGRHTLIREVAGRNGRDDGERAADCAAAGKDGMPLLYCEGSGRLHGGRDGDKRKDGIASYKTC